MTQRGTNQGIESFLEDALKRLHQDSISQQTQEDEAQVPEDATAQEDDDIMLGWTARQYVSATNRKEDFSAITGDETTTTTTTSCHKWTEELQPILHGLAYTAGLGNLWRFPYMCYKHGGGAFLLVYMIMLVTVGFSISLMESAVGQFGSKNMLLCWNLAPFFSGLGVAMSVVTFAVTCYYNVIVSWAWYYFFVSFSYRDGKLPWMLCPKNSSSYLCLHRVPDMTQQQCFRRNLELGRNGFCHDGDGNYHGFWRRRVSAKTLIRHLPSQDYLDYVALGSNQSKGFGDPGGFNFKMAGFLLLTWVIVYIAALKGTTATGKLLYFTVPYVFVILLLFLIRGLTLDGHSKGIAYFFDIKVRHIGFASLWIDAAVQLIHSLGLSQGIVSHLASRNRFHHDLVRDIVALVLTSILTALVVGVVTFSVVGHLAKMLHVPIAHAVKSGSLLTIVVFSEAIATLPFPPFWSVLFFLMLVCAGLNNTLIQLEVLVASFVQLFHPTVNLRRQYVLLGLVGLMFVFGLVICSHDAAYVFPWFDQYILAQNMLSLSLVECVAVVWVYGHDRLMDDLATMLGSESWHSVLVLKMSVLWQVLWFVFAPILLSGNLVFSLMSLETFRTSVNSKMYDYPVWSHTLGVTVFACVSFIIFAPGIVKLWRGREGSVRQIFTRLFKPDIYWGPRSCSHRLLVSRYVKGYIVDPWFYEEMMSHSKKALCPFALNSLSTTMNSMSAINKVRQSDLNPIREVDEPPKREETPV